MKGDNQAGRLQVHTGTESPEPSCVGAATRGAVSGAGGGDVAPGGDHEAEGQGVADEVRAAEDSLGGDASEVLVMFWSNINPYDTFRLAMASGSIRGFLSACLGSGRLRRPQCPGPP